MNQKEGQVGSTNGGGTTGLSNIPGPKAPPKFNSIFLTESSAQPLDLYTLSQQTQQQTTTSRPSTTSNMNAVPKSALRSRSQPLQVKNEMSSGSSKMPVIVDEAFTESDVNLLPRQSTAEDFITAIDIAASRPNSDDFRMSTSSTNPEENSNVSCSIYRNLFIEYLRIN